jgi:transcriptional regulator
LQKALDVKRAELEAKGLKVEATAIIDIAARLRTVRASLSDLRKKQTEHAVARATRDRLIADLYANREKLHQRRRAELKQIAKSANQYADNLEIRVSYTRDGLNYEWIDWLVKQFDFRRPRVNKLAELISPQEFADALLKEDMPRLLALADDGGGKFFSSGTLTDARKWPQCLCCKR